MCYTVNIKIHNMFNTISPDVKKKINLVPIGILFIILLFAHWHKLVLNSPFFYLPYLFEYLSL